MRDNGVALPPVCRRYDIAEESLSPVDRIILTSDGTVMRTLEALTRKRIVVNIRKRTVEDDVLARKIVLHSPDEEDFPLAWAESWVYLSRLNPEYARGLRNGSIGIGELVRNNRLETFREINEIDDQVPPEETPTFVETDTPVMQRTYDIYCQDKQAITITEYFRRGLKAFAEIDR
ncbi:chorismate pyruvate-lyase family protein [Halomicrobium sp. IBSBa]|uniref:chorismate--pyruvate lyase family protein n=1 Tax=Halomicrobium sp. IBSBa TaxID=2778916 RepID=UPI001ABFF9FD|nr:chorismate pyruvate-lyase family protein [Halomicrobium sp. IBSBa]